MTLEQKQAELARLLQQYNQISEVSMGPEVSDEQMSAFSRRLDTLAFRINALSGEIRAAGGEGCALVALNNPTVKINPLLDLFASGALDPAEVYRPTREQKQRQADQGRICSLGGGLD